MYVLTGTSSWSITCWVLLRGPGDKYVEGKSDTMRVWFLALVLVSLPIAVVAFDVAAVTDACARVAQAYLPVATAIFVVTSALGLAIRLRSRQRGR
jgi:hypothetical protein